jgi:hypothetical protein
MFQFYETTVLSRELGAPGAFGIQVLTSPPLAEGARVPYELLFEEDEALLTSNEVEQVFLWLEQAADPGSAWNQRMNVADTIEFSLRDEVAWPFAYTLVREPLVPVETSPLNKRSIADILALSGGAFVVLIQDLPAIVLVGEAVGLVVIRGLSAVTGALWEGARPEFVSLGRDAASMALEAVRRRLGIQRRVPVEDFLRD